MPRDNLFLILGEFFCGKNGVLIAGEGHFSSDSSDNFPMTEDYKKYPKLREDLKISKMVNKTNTHFVIKDPMKESYFRFSEDEMEIISLFNGERTLEQMVEDYNNEHDLSEIDMSVVEEFWNEINGMNLLVKSHDEMNVMLVEKVKEMRQFQLLSKKDQSSTKDFQ